MVVEAMMDIGVRKLPYSEWIRQREGELVWVARLKEVSAEKRSAVANEAGRYIGTRYDFWNFDLRDKRGFYCSKLAWLAISDGAGSPPDHNRESKRLLWYSPKQLMQSNDIYFVFKPGTY